MSRCVLSVFGCLLLLGIASGYNWAARYDGTGMSTDEARAIVADPAGNVYVTGVSVGAGTGRDILTIKYSPDGTVAWTRRFPGAGPTDDEPVAMVYDPLGHVFVAGMVTNATLDIVTLSYDATSGALLWSQTFDGPAAGADSATGVALDPSGNVYVCGTAAVGSVRQAVVLKYTNSGGVGWSQNVPSSAGDGSSGAAAIAATAQGVYVTGRARDALGTMDVLVAKLDVTNGATMWTRTYDGPSLANDMGTALVVDDTGNVVATGQSWGPGEYDYVTLKYASDGTPRWTMRYDGPGDIADVPAAVKLDAAYSVYVTGYSNSNSGWEDFATVKYSQTGTQRWVARYNTGSSLDDNARAMQIVGPYVYVTGFGESSNNDFDFVTVKYDTAGAQLWVARYNYDPEDDEDVSSGIAVTGPGVFYVTGHSYGGVATAFDYLTLKYFESDLAAVAVVAPTGTMPPQPVVPQVRVRNNGTAAASGTAYLRVLLGTTQLYADTQDVVGVPGADSVDVAFKPFVGGEGDYAARCSVVLAGDQDHSNDTTSGLFSLRYTTLPFWTEMPTVMLGPAMKFVKDGGGLCFGRYTETRNAVFCLRGNGTNEFLRYQLSGDSWHLCESLPYAPDANKRVKKGGAVTFALRDDTAAYAFKGANTLEFWRYDALRDSWSQRQNLLEGPRGKRIKGGAALAYYRNSSTEDRYIFALKGAKTNEFYAFHVQSQAWSARDTVPMGPRYKGMADGSALVNAGGTLYALKGGLNELYAYDIDADSWYARTPLPMYGASGRSRKAKYGSALAYGDGVVYCLKGGSREFWAYHPDADAWVELESLPLPPSLKKAVKGGGALTFGSDRIWAIKGNKTLDFYAYTPGTFGDKAEPGQVRRDGVMARQSTIADCRLTVAPNPLARGFATLRYTLPRAGAVSLGITDVTGRQVMTRTLTAGRTGTLTLDLRNLSAGVYLVKVTGDSYSVSQKLVVER